MTESSKQFATGESINLPAEIILDATHVMRCPFDTCARCTEIALRYAPHGVYKTLEEAIRTARTSALSEILRSEPTAWAIFASDTHEMIDLSLIEPDEAPGQYVEPLFARSATPQKPPRDPNVKYPRLFYWEDAEDCWCPAEGLEVDNIISTDLFFKDGDIEEIRFKREDMTDAEFEAIPEG